MRTLLWLDDYRDPRDKEIDWMIFSPIGRDVNIVWVKSYSEFTKWIGINGLPDAICFDHDLGQDVADSKVEKGMSKRQSRREKREEKSGYDAAKWLVDYCLDHDLNAPEYAIQSANPTGAANIKGLLDGFIKFRG